MLLKKQFFVLYFLFFSFNLCNAQIEVAHVSAKDFKSLGFGAFLNFSIPVSEANYVTLEGGLQYFKDKDADKLTLLPVLAGYRYTLNQTGTGLYIEPNAGYTFSVADFGDYAGPSAGIGVGYLIDLGNIPFNFGLRYERSFGNTATNVFAFRIAHSFSFGRKDYY
ncbi:MAG: hypothetical protein J0H55_12180 [Chitinophagaceae bacterium]|nr:hypothetical protein [Chitinophagaceae bacterium]